VGCYGRSNAQFVMGRDAACQSNRFTRREPIPSATPSRVLRIPAGRRNRTAPPLTGPRPAERPSRVLKRLRVNLFARRAGQRAPAAQSISWLGVGAVSMTLRGIRIRFTRAASIVPTFPIRNYNVQRLARGLHNVTTGLAGYEADNGVIRVYLAG
jgi:hypothetical protein